MADIAAADVTYTNPSTAAQTVVQGRRVGVFTIAFGDGTLTYPAGGVPMTKAKLGCPNVIEEFSLQDPASANGFVYKYDYANEKIRIYQGDYSEAGDGPLVELAGGSATPAAASLKVKVSGW